MDKVAQSKQLMAITNPEVLVLFEDWLEELEDEIISLVRKHGLLDAENLAEKLGFQERGNVPSLKAKT